MTDEDARGFDTDAIHAGYGGDPASGAPVPPIHQTTSYAFEDADDAAARYALESDENIYSRISNPTVKALEDRLAALSNAAGAVATASGMAAFDAATFVLAAAGDNVVSAESIYGGTRAYLSHNASRRGIEARFVDTLDLDAYREAIDEDTAFVHLETIGNPSLVVPDIEAVADVAHEHGVPLVVDNTFATPALCRPLEHGADVVWHSTTKWLHGSGTTLGGVLLDGGDFDWDGYAEISEPNPAYHGMVLGERFPDAPFAAAVRHRATRSLGNAQKPFDAWQTIQGLETLPLRIDRHCENARIVADYLDDHDDVAWVNYPGLDDHATHGNAERYLDGGYGGMVSFGLEGVRGSDAPASEEEGSASDSGFDAGRRLCESADLASFLANVGDAKTLVIHPASTTHAQLSEEEQLAAGVPRDLVRLSVGIEDPEDILADLDRAIAEATR
ncbi:O-acetylhomoserine aminocarboxypropyltransferase/cysteine synthase family protein [Halocalculus aciditolerans]|uniref:O-acetylhomoserine aminocarboxypropyltransferase n=1 Tax=Halocalculus aciditolerans TaxID=1383812 RepID=A0A830F7E8_9EURY|nr:O-acetylhomoserine aminocarboxypropyltransferase/cysteine synthase family protein [Halocalculus aciditolerans]GGL46981.1 O-acetylhomoserine aminocarboxypropyltransferase [Halocalculus aciditolerans]